MPRPSLAVLVFALAAPAFAGGMPPEVEIDANGVPVTAAEPARPPAVAPSAEAPAATLAAVAVPPPPPVIDQTPLAAVPAAETFGPYRADFGGQD